MECRAIIKRLSGPENQTARYNSRNVFWDSPRVTTGHFKNRLLAAKSYCE
ncbi:hypothetical protein BRYFOR_07158 [Marvinbryantia formatexigens DSM 14469]|uniref:Uncharacterized protein n=1 Tax=Marvinbryantia formatexigens DSM 14469 TaxID=478749 RepID=C6LEV7_9FIRM|nr:hypothetical protein BRYFOR_07158 [Marvinbryantia formatexigens DSM 14469]